MWVERFDIIVVGWGGIGKLYGEMGSFEWGGLKMVVVIEMDDGENLVWGG